MPRWLLRIKLGDVFHDESLTFVERRDRIVQRLRESSWFANDRESDVRSLVDELADADDEHTFNLVWEEIYDCADDDRVWIQTWKDPEPKEKGSAEQLDVAE